MRAARGCGPSRTIRLFVLLTVPSVVLSPSGWAFLSAGCSVGRTPAIVIARMTSGRGWRGHVCSFFRASTVSFWACFLLGGTLPFLTTSCERLEPRIGRYGRLGPLVAACRFLDFCAGCWGSCLGCLRDAASPPWASARKRLNYIPRNSGLKLFMARPTGLLSGVTQLLFPSKLQRGARPREEDPSRGRC